MSSVTYTRIANDDLLVPPNDNISLTGPPSGDYSYFGLFDFRIDHGQDVGGSFPVEGAANSRFFELYNIGSNSFYSNSNFGFEFRYFLEDGVTKTKMYARTAGNNFIYYITRNGMPQAGTYPHDNTDAQTLFEFFIVPGDIVRGYDASYGYRFEFTITDSMLFRYLHFDESNDPNHVHGGDSLDPLENDPPPSPVFVPRSARRGNLNFW